MITISFKKLRNLPISRLILSSIIIVSLLPLILLGPQIHQTIWDNAQREITEKHLLIAQNLAEPLRLFVNSHLDALQMLANTFQQFDQAETDKLQTLLNQAVHQAHDFNTLALLNSRGQTQALSINKNIQALNQPDYSSHRCFLKVLESGKKDISATHLSAVTNQPTIVMGQPIYNLENQIVAVLLAEINLQPIEKIRAKIRFGKNGHSAIFDAKGQALAHPNPDWAAGIKNLSHLPIVQQMMAGKTGVMEFYSPHIKADMIAGFTGIKELGWGIMVPQPRAEINEGVAAILNSLLAWSLLGVIIAVIAAFYLTQWISRPLNRLASQAQRIANDDKQLPLRTVAESAPREVVQMTDAIQSLVDDLQASNREVNKLNNSLQERINLATSELLDANNSLQKIASSDHLTTIANRRFFETTVSDIIGHKPGKTIGIMLVDIDNFKHINDQFGHAAGDYVLTTVARLLDKATRPGDIIARYGGDEFVAEFETDIKTIQKRAEDLRKTVADYPFSWKQKSLHVTLSIGITCHKTNSTSSLDQLMTVADTAMYQAKNTGRNKVALLAS